MLCLLAVVCPAVITDDYRYIAAHAERHPRLPTSTDLLGVLLEQAQLEALVQLELADVPGLVEVLPGGVQFVQQLGDPWHQALGVRVTNPAAAAATATATAAAAVAVGERLAALDSLEQPGDGDVEDKLPSKSAVSWEGSTTFVRPSSDTMVVWRARVEEKKTRREKARDGKPPPHNTPTHMARDGRRRSDS
ncbi:hypothetical protein EYF80_014263 [Liparis tanakae]|uniref:Uncharacterized protein n=1 Tax=Liparis tanakae TaxID=230148 RepID=A0A4Z2ICL1_9TELE|nr:hypothetical protein EYF80_014263 [Liparis tanakae]